MFATNFNHILIYKTYWTIIFIMKKVNLTNNYCAIYTHTVLTVENPQRELLFTQGIVMTFYQLTLVLTCNAQILIKTYLFNTVTTPFTLHILL